MNMELPRAHGERVLVARMRSVPEDFRVDEVLGFEPSGAGEHLLLDIEKRGANTVWVAQRLAQWAGIAEHGVSYAGLKDRHAVTRQTFSVHLPRRVAPELAALPQDAGFRVLSQTWHSRKLPRGALRGNRFLLRLREVRAVRQGAPYEGVEGRHAIDARLQAIATQGVPNYFGEQRFGRDGGNLDAARAMFAGKRMGRDKRSILLSAARSHLFNRLLAQRVERGDWNRGIDGEVWMLDGTHSVFGPEPITPELAQRCDALDIHPTGALWGEGEPRSTAQVAELEHGVAREHADLVDGLRRAGLRQERRALRLPVRDLQWDWPDSDLELSFFLPAGSYATSVLHALGDVESAATVAGFDVE